MAGLLQENPSALLKLRQAGVISPRELGFGEGQIQTAERFDRLMELRQVLAKHLAPGGEDALDFRELALLEFHQFVIERQGLERLDEDRGARGARAVDDALDAPLFLYFHRQNKAVEIGRASCRERV